MSREKILTTQCLFLSLLFSLLCSGAWASDLSASVDRSRVALNESLTLTLTYQGQTMSAPDFSPLEKDFNILSRQQQSKLSLGFGNNDSTTEWVLGLMPRRKGELEIPALGFNGEQSAPINVTVTEPQASNDSSQPIFIETELGESSAYVKGQVLLTIRLNTSVRISSLEVSDLVIADAQVLKVAESQYQKLINGRDHVVVEVKYAIFPEKSGTLNIPPIRISGIVPDRRDPFNSPFGGSSIFGSRGKTFHLATEEKSVKVKPIPGEASNLPWLPAKGVSVSQRWSDRSSTLKVGEPITRSITISTQGQMGAQIPPLNMPAGDGYKLYPDQPEISESVSESGVLGTRTESVAIVPTKPGTLTLPATVVRWWDTEAGELKETQIEAMTLEVAPAADSQQPQSPSTQDESDQQTEAKGSDNEAPSNRLLTLSLAANLVLLIMLFALAASGRRKPRPRPQQSFVEGTTESSEKMLFKELKATNSDNRAEFRDRLLRWGALFWPDRRVLVLDDIARLAQQPKLKNLFANLDDSLYGSHSAQVDTTQILAILKDVRKQSPTGSPNKHSAPLKSLYPEHNQA